MTTTEQDTSAPIKWRNGQRLDSHYWDTGVQVETASVASNGAVIGQSARSDSNSSSTLACVLPCHNEAENLIVLLPVLIDVLTHSATNWKIVLVDDGSTDDTVNQVAGFLSDSRICLIELSRNFGKEAAITAGLEHTRTDAVIVMDADGQHPPDTILPMLGKWRLGFDVVTAIGKPETGDYSFRNLANRAFYLLINLGSPVLVERNAGDFRLMNRATVNALLSLPERTRFMKGLYSWVGFSATTIRYEPGPRRFGTTKFGLVRLLSFSIDGLAAFSNWPLFAIAGVGALISVMSIAYGFFIALQYLFIGHSISGWSTLAVALFVSGGLQLLGIGVLGIYLAKVFDEVKQRPLYVVRRRLTNANSVR